MQAWTSLYAILSPERRRHLLVTLVLMVLAAAAELTTVAASLAFLTLAMGSVGSPAAGFAGTLLAAVGAADMYAAATVLTAALVAAAAMRLWLLWRTQRLVTAVAHDLAAAIFDSALRQPWIRHVNRNQSLVFSGMEKVNAVTSGVLQPGMQALVAGTVGAALAALLIAIHPWAAAAGAGAVAGTYLLVAAVVGRRLRKNSATLSAAATARTRRLREALGSMRDILLGGYQQVFSESFRVADGRLRRALAANAVMSQAPRHVIEAAAAVSFVGMALVATGGSGGAAGSIPVLGALAIGAFRLLPLAQQVYAGWSSSAGNFEALRDVLALLKQPEAREAPLDGTLPFTESLELRRVTFNYGKNAFALGKVDLAISAGSRTGIVGPTGDGKSTLIDLMMGLLEPESGEIRVDGRLLDGRTRPLWQAQLAHVPQSIYLLDDSIAANIAFGVPADRCDPARIARCAAAACLGEFLNDLPEGLQTKVGDQGIRLSGGQRQRIALARALYRNPCVLILDEATSALDERTEEAVLRSILAFRPNLTVIMIAHRPASLRGCDTIVEMRGGRIVTRSSGGAASPART